MNAKSHIWYTEASTYYAQNLVYLCRSLLGPQIQLVLNCSDLARRRNVLFQPSQCPLKKALFVRFLRHQNFCFIRTLSSASGRIWKKNSSQILVQMSKQNFSFVVSSDAKKHFYSN